MPEQDRSTRVRMRALTLPGSWTALVLACLSFTPSLLPRGTVLQGAVTGISAVIGYGLGVLGAWVWRELADHDAREARPWSWRVLVTAAVVGLGGSFVLGQHWQAELRDLVGAEPAGASALLALPVAALVLVLVLALGRGLQAVYRWLAGLFARRLGDRAARVSGLIVVVTATWLLVSGLLLQGLVSVVDSAFAARNGYTEDGVEQPSSALRSGGPGSLISWDSLGRWGRTFAAAGPTPEQISAFSGAPATEPIRVFAGLGSAEDAQTRAELAVADLARTGGFDRDYLLVATTTGSGWLDPAAVGAFEYMTGGSSAIVSMQYSYLPSWVSYLVDQQRAREAGRHLFDEVYSRWSRLPVDDRPRLLVFGESLGSFGGETAFSGEHDLANRTDGVLFVGPPSFNPLYREFTDDRDAGSPEVAPVLHDGRTVRFAAQVEDGVPPVGAPWDGARVLYLLHPSDPIVWWSPDLILDRPDWLAEPTGADVLGQMVWIPFVTFWQVSADLPGAGAMQPGYGHVYIGELVDGWAAVLQPPGWTPQRAAQLREVVTSESSS